MMIASNGLCSKCFNYNIWAHNGKCQSVMLEVHEKGRAVCGTYSYEVAEQKCVETITESDAIATHQMLQLKKRLKNG